MTQIYHYDLLTKALSDKKPEDFTMAIVVLDCAFNDRRMLEGILGTGGGCVETWVAGATPPVAVRNIILSKLRDFLIEIEKLRETVSYSIECSDTESFLLACKRAKTVFHNAYFVERLFVARGGFLEVWINGGVPGQAIRRDILETVDNKLSTYLYSHTLPDLKNQD